MKKKRKKNHYNVNLTNKENKTFLSSSSFFFFFFFFLISDISLKTHHYTELDSQSTVFVSLYQRMIKTYILSFSISFVCLVVILLILCIIPLGTQQQLTHPPVKSSTLPLSKMPVFHGVAPRHTIFTSSCVIPLWDSATAHLPSGKELNPSSQEDARFSGHCSISA